LHVGLWEKIFPNAELHFCDISSVAIEKLKEKHPKYDNKCSLVVENRAGFSDGTFDVVVSVEVMEHVEDLNAYLRDINRLLRPGGVFVWTTPCANKYSIEHIYSALTGKIEETEEGYVRWEWEDPTHLRRLKSKEIDGVLRENGFTDIFFRFRSHFFSFVCTYLPVRRFERMRNNIMTLDYSLFRLLPNGASMIAVAKKPTHTETG
jgi:SAM-dependent methyltransferase